MSAPFIELFVVALLLTGVVALADALGRHRTANGTAAAHELTRGAQARMFWTSLALGVLLPVPIALIGGAAPLVIAAALALAGLWLHGHAFILAGQGPPIS